MENVAAAGSILVTVLKTYPFAEVTREGSSIRPLAWADVFWGSLEFYSFPSSPEEVSERIQENVGRFFGNYRMLLTAFFFVFLYQTPLAFAVVLSLYPISHYFKKFSNDWGIDNQPVVREALVRVFQCVVVVILYYLNVLVVLLCTLVATYVAMMVHAAAREIESPNTTETFGDEDS